MSSVLVMVSEVVVVVVVGKATIVVAISIEGLQIDGAVTSRGAGCCVSMVTANGPGSSLCTVRPARLKFY